MKLLWLVLILVAVPIVPVLLVDEDWDRRLGELASEAGDRHHAALALTVGALLAADIFLPTPSGPLATLAGASLGAGPAFVAVWSGLMVGAAVGRQAARSLGRPVASRLAGTGQIEQLEVAFAGRERWLLLVTRPLPVVAETTVLLAGVAGVPWRRFLPPVALGNLVFAGALIAVGRFAAANNALTLAIAFSILVPIVALIGFRSRMRSISSA